MESCGGEREQPGGVAGAATNIEVGALVWVVRRNGSWWPGRILGMDELPEDCSIPPRHTVTPIKLLGRPNGSIDWYNLEKSKRVKPFWCGEFDECIENAKVQARLQNMSQNEGKCRREYAIMHALEIEKSRFPPEGHLKTYGSCESINNQVSKPVNQNTKCSKAGTCYIRDHRRSKIKIISLTTPISEGSPKSDDNLLPLEHEGTMKCHAPDSDAVELEARVEGAACEPTDLENNIQVYDVEVTGNYMGLGLPLAFLTSKSIGNPVKGYPVSVEVLEDYCSAANIDDHLPSIGNLECLLKSRVPLPKKKRLPQSRPGVHKKVNLHDLDKSSWPHAKKLATDASPRKIQRPSSSLSNRRDQRLMQQGPLVGLMSPYYGWQLHQEEEIEEDEEKVAPLHFAATSTAAHARESSKQNPVIEKGSLLGTHSPPGANCKPVEKGSLLRTCSPLGTREYHLRPMTIISGSCSPPLTLSPAATATGSRNGCPSLYSRRSQNTATTVSHQAPLAPEAGERVECIGGRAIPAWILCPAARPLMLSAPTASTVPVSERVLLDPFLLDGPAPPMIVDGPY